MEGRERRGSGEERRQEGGTGERKEERGKRKEERGSYEPVPMPLAPLRRMEGIIGT